MGSEQFDRMESCFTNRTLGIPLLPDNVSYLLSHWRPSSRPHQSHFPRAYLQIGDSLHSTKLRQRLRVFTSVLLYLYVD